jgi:hypothetical protein
LNDVVSHDSPGGRVPGRTAGSHPQFIESESAMGERGDSLPPLATKFLFPSLQRNVHRAIGLEKGKVETMTTVHFFQKTRQALVPMRKAALDALLLAAFILIGLLFTGILLSYPWLILPIYALAYLLTVMLRLRQAARETTAASNPYNYLFH